MTKILARNDLQPGMLVEINPQSDRSRKTLLRGKILKLLTKSENHPHGILVLLESGEKGRVKKVVVQES